MIRVLHVVSSFRPGNGISEYIMQYQRFCDHKRVEFNLLVLGKVDEDYANEFTSYSGKIIKCELSSNPIMWSREIHNSIKDHIDDFDIIEIHDLVFTKFIIKAIKKFNFNNVIAHAHSSRLSNNKIKEIRNRLFVKNIESNFSELWGCSNEAIDAWFPNSKTPKSIIPNALNCDELFSVSYIEDKVELGSIIKLGHVGRLSVEKNQLFILDVHKDLLRKGYSVETILIGDGESKEVTDILTKAKELGIENSLFLKGYLPKTALYNEMSKFTHFLFPSYFEGFGTALIEAQALGIKSFANLSIPKNTDIGLVKYLDLTVKDWSDAIEETIIESYIKEPNIAVKEIGFCLDDASVNLVNKYYDIYNKMKV